MNREHPELQDDCAMEVPSSGVRHGKALRAPGALHQQHRYRRTVFVYGFEII